MALFERNVSPVGPPQIINGSYFIPANNGSYINPDYCTNEICPLVYGELRYVPSFAGNLAYLLIFASLLLAQMVAGLRCRIWGFMYGMLFGGVLEIIGYVGRLLLHSNDFDFNYFVIYLVSITIAPAFLSASIYLCLSRLAVACGTGVARFSPKTYTITFVCCDILSLALQATGGGLAATSKTGDQTGVNIMIAGLSFQVGSLTLFMFLAADFAWSVRKASPYAMNPAFVHFRRSTVFRIFPYALALATITVYIRCCYRVAELEHGFGGSLANNQTLFMVFEGPQIMIAMLSLTVFHPGFAFGGAEGWRSADWAWKERLSDTPSSESESVGAMAKTSAA